MMHKIIAVKPLEDLILSVFFQNGIEKEYDVKSLFLQFPQFEILKKDRDMFFCVNVDAGGYGIAWNDHLDLNAEDIWENGREVGRHEISITAALAETLMEARETVGITQKQLAEKTGIYQSDISKIERGLANPSLSTLQRLAEGMGAQLKIDFIFE